MSEVEGKTTLSFHGITGCMFHCYKCFNYEDIILHPPKERWTIQDVKDTILKQVDLIDLVLISGAEFLNAKLEDIIEDLTYLKQSIKTPIILYSTGAFDEKLERLIHDHLIDGVHIDMKLPYHLLTKEDAWIIKKTMGIGIDKWHYIEAAMKSIELVVKNDLGLSQIRSVRYPFLDESAFEACHEFVESLNLKYFKHTPYEAHPFYDMDAQKKTEH
jgi:pyruvate-formate lyase-activating enzyme